MKWIASKVIEILFSLAVMISYVAVNSTCHYRFYQETMDEQLNRLRKHYD